MHTLRDEKVVKLKKYLNMQKAFTTREANTNYSDSEPAIFPTPWTDGTNTYDGVTTRNLASGTKYFNLTSVCPFCNIKEKLTFFRYISMSMSHEVFLCSQATNKCKHSSCHRAQRARRAPAKLIIL